MWPLSPPSSTASTDRSLIAVVRHGRERRYPLAREPLDGAKVALEAISRHSDQALARLKAFVES